jgi:hypothetical protein
MQVTEIEKTDQGVSPEILALIHKSGNKGMQQRVKDATINYLVKDTDFV